MGWPRSYFHLVWLLALSLAVAPAQADTNPAPTTPHNTETDNTTKDTRSVKDRIEDMDNDKELTLEKIDKMQDELTEAKNKGEIDDAKATELSDKLSAARERFKENKGDATSTADTGITAAATAAGATGSIVSGSASTSPASAGTQSQISGGSGFRTGISIPPAALASVATTSVAQAGSWSALATQMLANQSMGNRAPSSVPNVIPSEIAAATSSALANGKSPAIKEPASSGPSVTFGDTAIAALIPATVTIPRGALLSPPLINDPLPALPSSPSELEAGIASLSGSTRPLSTGTGGLVSAPIGAASVAPTVERKVASYSPPILEVTRETAPASGGSSANETTPPMMVAALPPQRTLPAEGPVLSNLTPRNAGEMVARGIASATPLSSRSDLPSPNGYRPGTSMTDTIVSELAQVANDPGIAGRVVRAMFPGQSSLVSVASSRSAFLEPSAAQLKSARGLMTPRANTSSLVIAKSNITARPVTTGARGALRSMMDLP